MPEIDCDTSGVRLVIFFYKQIVAEQIVADCSKVRTTSAMQCMLDERRRLEKKGRG